MTMAVMAANDNDSTGKDDDNDNNNGNETLHTTQTTINLLFGNGQPYDVVREA